MTTTHTVQPITAEERKAAARMLDALKLCRDQYAERGTELKEITRAIATAEAAGITPEADQ